MNREQAKAYKAMVQLISFRDSKQIAFQLLNQAVGHNGIEKHWDVFCHFADGGNIEIYCTPFNEWKVIDFDVSFNPEHKYRKAEKPFILGGIKLPERPQTEPLEVGQKYFFIGSDGDVAYDYCSIHEHHKSRLKTHNVFLTIEGAEAFNEARLAMVQQALKGEE